MSSKPHKIFGPHTSRVGGIETVTGRNAQFPTMTRKQQYGQMVGSERPYISPFSGYTSSSQNNLAVSQAFQFNPELTRKIVREQLEKQVKQEPIRNDVSILKAQIRSIKEFLDGYKGRMDRQSEEERENLQNQIKAQMAGVLEQYRVQTARNLREVLKKFDENIKKQIFVQFGNKFLPLSFVDDMDKQFNELEDRIQMAETKLMGHKNRPSEDPVVIAETFELRLKKIERESQYLKKTLTETQTLLEKLQTESNEMKNKQESDNQKISYLGDDFHKLKQQLDKQTKKVFHTIEENNKLINSIWDDKLKSISEDLNKKLSNSSSSEVKQFLNSSNNLTVSAMFESQKNGSNDSFEKNQSIVKPLFKSPPKDTRISKEKENSEQKMREISAGKNNQKDISKQIHQSPMKKQNQNSIKDPSTQKQKTQKGDEKVVYLIDKDNFLMDSDGNYITNTEGKQIKLTVEQIDIIRTSNIVKMIEE